MRGAAQTLVHRHETSMTLGTKVEEGCVEVGALLAAWMGLWGSWGDPSNPNSADVLCASATSSSPPSMTVSLSGR